MTSGTILASRKLEFTDLLAAICILVNAAKGISALQLARDLDCQHKTAFVLAHKLREAMAAETKGRRCSVKSKLMARTSAATSARPTSKRTALTAA